MIREEIFVEHDALGRIRAVDAVYGDKALLLSSMQKTASVLMHMIAMAKAKTIILFVDTQFHFPETLAVRDEFVEKYGLDIKTVYPDWTPEQQERKFGRKLYHFKDGQPECCNIRKERPYLKAAREFGIEASLAGLMRAEGGERANVEPIGVDKRLGSANFHPLFDWSYDQVEAYLKDNDVPVHPLHAQAYPSIGCAPCTTPIVPGEGPRAGRWRHLSEEDGSKPEYCNINFADLGEGI